MTIELEAKFVRGRGSVDEYLTQTAIANPHVTLHYLDPDGNQRDFSRSAKSLPPEPKEIKPHPYGVELGRLAAMLQEDTGESISQFLTTKFSRVSSGVARKICATAKVSSRANTRKMGRKEAEALYQAIQGTRIAPPATDCISPIGEELILKGLHQVVPGEFYAAATRPPAVYRGNPFQIEVGLAFGGQAATQNVTKELLRELIEETDARTIRQFLDSHVQRPRRRLGRQDSQRIGPRHAAIAVESQAKGSRSVAHRDEGRERGGRPDDGSLPLCQPRAAAVPAGELRDHADGPRHQLAELRPVAIARFVPKGPVTLMVHIASVWVPFTSESKEAVASYPEIQKELRLALQAVGRNLGMYVRNRLKVKQQGDRRQIFLRYLGEVATAVSDINAVDRGALYDQLVSVAKKRTSDADMKLDERGRPIEDEELELGKNVLIVDPLDSAAAINRTSCNCRKNQH